MLLCEKAQFLLPQKVAKRHFDEQCLDLIMPWQCLQLHQYMSICVYSMWKTKQEIGLIFWRLEQVVFVTRTLVWWDSQSHLPQTMSLPYKVSRIHNSINHIKIRVSLSTITAPSCKTCSQSKETPHSIKNIWWGRLKQRICR